MNLTELKARGMAEAKQRGITFAALLGEHRVMERGFRHAVTTGASIDLATAQRLLPLVAALARPGELAELECLIGGGEMVLMTRAARQSLVFTHQPN